MGRGRTVASRRFSVGGGAALALIGHCLAAPPARAQAQPVAGFAVDRFEPAGGGSEWLTLESLDFRGHLRPAGVVTADWAWKPLVIYDQNGSQVAALVQHQAVLHAGVAMVLWERVRLDLNVPVAVLQRGTGAAVDGQIYAAPAGAGVGDVRLGLDVRLFGRAGGAVTGAVGVQVFLPTGHIDAFTSDGAVRIWPRLALAGEGGPFVWAARAGYHVRPRNKCGCGLEPGDELTGGAAAGLRLTPSLLVGPEVYASSARANLGKHASTPVEALIGAHLAVARDWSVSAGVAPGLTDGTGSPAVRVVAGVQYWPALPHAPAPPAPTSPVPPPTPPPRAVPKPIPPPPPPPPDKDGDGVPDAQDACPGDPGEPSSDPDRNGCPAPADRDGDGIVDGEDACPDAAGPRNADPAKNGCPVARIEGGQIRIREQVKFKTASARILRESDYILDAVVKVLVEHAEITKVRVEGHTDSRGGRRYNKKLSDKRAASVVKWLIKHGIDKRRLTSEGFGLERPMATNQTDEGRRQNRRVEIHIVEGPGAEP